MGVIDQIVRLQDIRDRQQAKLSAMGLTADTATLEDCTDAVEDIADNGAVSATLDGTTATSYTIPKGYHNGAGTVSLTDEAVELIASASSATTTPDRMKDVRFFDYDGTLLYSYTFAEAAELAALPDLPEHDGLVCQGWNYDLATVKAATRKLDIGAMYVTDDGATRIYLQFADDARLAFPFSFTQDVSGGVTIEWGDDSDPETLSGTGVVSATHQYPAAGSYTLTLTVEDGCTLKLTGASNYSLVGLQYATSLTSAATGQLCYARAIKKVEIGANCTTIGAYSFIRCSSLTSISIPDSVTSIGTCAFYYSAGLPFATIPASMKSITGTAFQGCSGLTSISIPDGVTSIGTYAFYSCSGLTSISIPDGVTSIGTYAFYRNFSMAAMHLLPTTPPTLSATNALEGIPDDCVIYVPSGSLAAYQSATNWSAYADYMEEE